MTDRRAFGEWLVRIAMLAHPRAFRARYRDEMLAYYRRAFHAGDGWSWRVRFVATSVLAALGEGWRQRRRHRHQQLTTHGRLAFARSASLGLLQELRLACRSLTVEPALTAG